MISRHGDTSNCGVSTSYRDLNLREGVKLNENNNKCLMSNAPDQLKNIEGKFFN